MAQADAPRMGVQASGAAKTNSGNEMHKSTSTNRMAGRIGCENESLIFSERHMRSRSHD
jgi:hypothetical protein